MILDPFKKVMVVGVTEEGNTLSLDQHAKRKTRGVGPVRTASSTKNALKREPR